MEVIYFMQHRQHKMVALLEDSTTGWILLERSYTPGEYDGTVDYQRDLSQRWTHLHSNTHST